MKSVKYILMAMLALLSINISGAYNSNTANNSAFHLKSDSKTAAAKSKDLLIAIAALKTEALTESEHNTWMKVMDGLKRGAKAIRPARKIALIDCAKAATITS